MIELRGLSKTYGDGTRALAPLDLEFGDGVLGLLGPNGAGKTTLLSMLVLALEPTEGQRSYFGHSDAPSVRALLRSWIGYLAQEFETIPGLSGREYLRTCARFRQLPLRSRQLEQRIDRLLDAVGLSEAADQRTAEYSGGMLRRLGLAQALIHGPRLLVVDEPTAGLDPEERIRFRNIVTELGDRIPIVLSTHIVEDIEATCPRIGILSHGHLIFDGTPGDVFDRSRDKVWQLEPGEATGQHSVIGQRSHTSEAQPPRQVVFSASRPTAGAIAVEPTLEEAYAAFLVERTSGHDSARSPWGHELR